MRIVDGFKQRGEDMTRLETFTDAAFAFAVTLLVVGVLVYVYPLESTDDVRVMFIIFGTACAALSGVIVLLNRNALAQRRELQLTEYEVYETVSTIQHWLINMAVPSVSIVLALVVVDAWLLSAGMIYAVFGVLLPWHSIRRARARPA